MKQLMESDTRQRMLHKISSLGRPGQSLRFLSVLPAYLFLTAVAVTVALPFFWMISTSLKSDIRAVFQLPPQWIPDEPRFANYIDAWRAAPFTRYAFNSVLVAVSAVTLQLINACLSAYVFSRIHFRGRNALFLLFLGVMMIPNQVLAVPNYIFLSRLKWLDTYLALILPFAASGFGTFLIRQSFLAVPRDLIDAAIVDGANHLQILRHIMIPLSRPALVTFGLLSFTWRWNDYFWPLVMTNSKLMRTLPVGVALMRAGPEGGCRWHIVMAASTIVILPALVIFIIGQRYFVEGVAHSGLKGI